MTDFERALSKVDIAIASLRRLCDRAEVEVEVEDLLATMAQMADRLVREIEAARVAREVTP